MPKYNLFQMHPEGTRARPAEFVTDKLEGENVGHALDFWASTPRDRNAFGDAHTNGEHFLLEDHTLVVTEANSSPNYPAGVFKWRQVAEPRFVAERVA